MVAKLNKWIVENQNALSIIAKYWLPIFGEAFLSTFVGLLKYIGVFALSTIYSLLITYKRGEDMSNFFIPHFAEGILYAFITFFIFNLFLEASKRMHKKDIEIRRKSFMDVDIVSFEFEEYSGINGVGLKIVSDKPIENPDDIQYFEAKIIKVVRSTDTIFTGSFKDETSIKLPLIYKRGLIYEKANGEYIARRYDINLSTVILVANCDDNQATIPNEKNIEIKATKDNPIWVTIYMNARTAFGPSSGDEMEGLTTVFKIGYDTKRSQFLITDLERNPKYER